MFRPVGGSRRQIVIILLILLSVGLTALDPRGRMADQTRTLAAHVFAPGQGWLKNFTLSLVGDGSDQAARRDGGLSPQEEIRRLQGELRKAETDNASQEARIADLRRQVTDLAALRDSLSDYPLVILPAHVLSRQYLLPHGDLKIDVGSSRGAAAGHWVLSRFITRGKKDGVREGQPVLTGNGLVGLVDQTSEGFSQVRLVTSEKCILTARVMHWDAGGKGQWIPQPEGQLRGSGDGRTMHLDWIPRTASVAPGDCVVTAGSEAGLPEYAIVGVVTEVSSRPVDGSFRITVRPRVDLEALNQVYVLSPRKAQP